MCPRPLAGARAAGAACDTSKSIPQVEGSAYSLRVDRNLREDARPDAPPHDRLALPLSAPALRPRSLALAGHCARLPGRDVRHDGGGVRAKAVLLPPNPGPHWTKLQYPRLSVADPK